MSIKTKHSRLHPSNSLLTSLGPEDLLTLQTTSTLYD